MTAPTLHMVQVEQALFEVRRVVVGNRRLIDRLVIGMLAGGAVTIAGPHGVGKSFAARTVAHVLGLSPYVQRFSRSSESVHLGGAGSLMLLPDLNMASPAILGELADCISGNINVDLVATTAIADPTALPRRLRDEIMLYVEVPYPDADVEAELALGNSKKPGDVARLLQPSDLGRLRVEVAKMAVKDDALRYAVDLVRASRSPAAAGLSNLESLVGTGASPRASIALLRAARASAFLAGRFEVTSQDVYDVAFDVLVHRIEPRASARLEGVGAGDLLVELLTRVPA